MPNARDDIGRVALGAPALKEVFVVSIPDCALVKSWSRAGRSNEDEAAARFGALFRSASAALLSAVADQAARTITVESDDALIRLEAVSHELLVGFVFDRSAPLGLVNVQAMQLCDHIRASIEEFQKPRAESAPAHRPDPPTTFRAPPRRLPTPDLHRPIAGDLGGVGQGFERDDTPLSGDIFPGGFPDTTSSTVADVDAPPDAPPIHPAATHLEPSLSFEASEDAGTIEDDAPASSSSPHGIPDATTAPGNTPRVVRLLDFFRRYVPDRHAAMLRLSLRTGIPVERLESPEGLDDTQVEAIATSVREILGQDKVGV